MVPLDIANVQEKILEKVIAFGATTAGFADIEALKTSHSYEIYHQKPYYSYYEGFSWPEDAKSVLVITLEHPLSEPELDYWYYVHGHTPGNRHLDHILQKLASWLETEYQIVGSPLGYRIENGGVLLKDAAALAGLGVIGKNNLIITPEFGPRVRLRAMFINVPFKATGPIDYSPCNTCHKPCFAACPQGVFREGTYNRDLCDIQMSLDEENEIVIEVEGTDNENRNYRIYCRACEAACPVGR
jgi:epoxyqueuosine reductase